MRGLNKIMLINHDKLDNSLGNLQLMTTSEHARLHAIHNLKNRKRDNKGRFTCHVA